MEKLLLFTIVLIGLVSCTDDHSLSENTSNAGPQLTLYTDFASTIWNEDRTIGYRKVPISVANLTTDHLHTRFAIFDITSEVNLNNIISIYEIYSFDKEEIMETSFFDDVIAKKMFNQTVKLSFDGLIVEYDKTFLFKSGFKFMNLGSEFTPIALRVDEKNNNKSHCLNYWFCTDVINQTGCTYLYTICSPTLNDGDTGGGSGTPDPTSSWPKTCFKYKTFYWDLLTVNTGRNLTTEGEFILFKECASCWPVGNARHRVNPDQRVLGRVFVGSTGDYIGNGWVKGQFTLEHTVSGTFGGTGGTSSKYHRKFADTRMDGDCY